MKKLIFVLLIGALATVTYWSNSAQVELEDLLLENVEALSAGEGSGTVRCVGSGSVDCPFDHSKVKIVFGGYSLEDAY